MLKEERFSQILQELSKDHKVTLKSLSKLLGVSDYTIRRDLKQLTDQGLLRAVRGGAIPHSPTPHLDGRYTIFAEVIDGMEVVQQIEAGDEITDVTIPETETNLN